MKNKYLILGLTIMTLAGMLSSCKEKVDVTGTCKDIAHETIVGTTGIRSGLHAEDCSTSIVQYQFLGDNKAVRTDVVWGNKCAYNALSMPLSYTVDEFVENGFGLNLLCTPAGDAIAPYSLCFVNNELVESGTGLQYALSGTDDKVGSLQAIDSTFTNVRCEYAGEEWWTKKVKYNDTIFNKKVIIEGGQKKIVVDTIVTEKERIDTICQKLYLKNHFEFYRNATTYENTGVYSHTYKEWTEDKSLVEDTTFTYNFHWGLAGVTSGKKFDVYIVSDDPKLKDSFTAGISKFDPVKETITIDGNAYTMLKPE